MSPELYVQPAAQGMESHESLLDRECALSHGSLAAPAASPDREQPLLQTGVCGWQVVILKGGEGTALQGQIQCLLDQGSSSAEESCVLGTHCGRG